MSGYRSVLIASALAALVFSTVVSAQSVAEKYIISAKAGGVNAVEGLVTRTGATNGTLLKGDQVDVGDRIATTVNGRVEILLNPGSFVRLGSDSEFAFQSTSLDDLRATLYRGAAIFEVYATDHFRVDIATPKGAVQILNSGVYRVDIDAAGDGRLAVISGQAHVDGRTAELKKGHQEDISSTAVATNYPKSESQDDLGRWSKDRSKELAKVTSSLSTSTLSNSLLASYKGGLWNPYSSFGLWIMDPAFGYCFLPFGNGWNSPYGYGFGVGLDWYYFQRYFGPRYTPPSSGGGGGGPTGGGTTTVAKNTGKQGHITPRLSPASEIDRQQAVRRGDTGRYNGYSGGGRSLGSGSSSGSPFGGSSGSGPTSSGGGSGRSISPGPAISPSSSSAGKGGRMSPID